SCAPITSGIGCPESSWIVTCRSRLPRRPASTLSPYTTLFRSAAAKILVADDDQSLVRTLTWILKENGYEVSVAPGGEGLMGKLEIGRAHVLLLDIMMPKVDGLQLLAKMQADERFRDLPVLMISSMP